VFHVLPIARPSGKTVFWEHITPCVPSSVCSSGIPSRVFSSAIFCSSLKYCACCRLPFCRMLSARVKKPPPGPISRMKVPAANFRHASCLAGMVFPSASTYTHGMLSCPIFSSSVILPSRSSTRRSMGWDASRYSARSCAAAASTKAKPMTKRKSNLLEWRYEESNLV